MTETFDALLKRRMAEHAERDLASRKPHAAPSARNEVRKSSLAYQAEKESKRQLYHDDPEFRAKRIAAAAKWHKEHPEKSRQYSRKWRETHLEQAKASARARRNRHLAAMTPEELAAYKKLRAEYMKEWWRKREAAMTPEELAAHKKRRSEEQRARYRERLATMTPEELAAFRARTAEANRRRRAREREARKTTNKTTTKTTKENAK